MPLYEFHCPDCERDSEILVRTTEWKGTSCPHCGSVRLVKKLSLFASAGSEGAEDAGVCTGNPTSCCCCGGGGGHRH